MSTYWADIGMVQDAGEAPAAECVTAGGCGGVEHHVVADMAVQLLVRRISETVQHGNVQFIFIIYFRRRLVRNFRVEVKLSQLGKSKG